MLVFCDDLSWQGSELGVVGSLEHAHCTGQTLPGQCSMGWAQRVVPLQDVGTRSTELPLSPAPSPQCEWLARFFELSDPGWDQGWHGGPRPLVQVAFSLHVFGRAPERRGGHAC